MNGQKFHSNIFGPEFLWPQIVNLLFEKQNDGFSISVPVPLRTGSVLLSGNPDPRAICHDSSSSWGSAGSGSVWHRALLPQTRNHSNKGDFQVGITDTLQMQFSWERLLFKTEFLRNPGLQWHLLFIFISQGGKKAECLPLKWAPCACAGMKEIMNEIMNKL